MVKRQKPFLTAKWRGWVSAFQPRHFAVKNAFFVASECSQKWAKYCLGKIDLAKYWKKKEQIGIFDRKMARLGFSDYKRQIIFFAFILPKTPTSPFYGQKCQSVLFFSKISLNRYFRGSILLIFVNIQKQQKMHFWPRNGEVGTPKPNLAISRSKMVFGVL